MLLNEYVGAAYQSYFVCPPSNCENVYVVGVPITFDITSVDGLGNVATTGGEQYIVLVAGPGEITPHVKDNENGSYTVTICADVSGDYTLNVKVRDTTIQGSPCNLSFQPGILIIKFMQIINIEFKRAIFSFWL
jgi:hypothetical protein